MNYRGKVTHIDLEFCRFILDERITVYACYLFHHTKLIRMPSINTIVTILEGDFHKNTVILNAKSKIDSNNYHKTGLNLCYRFIRLIKDTSLNPNDFIKLLQICEKTLKEAFSFKNDSELKECIFKYFQYFTTISKEFCVEELEILTPKYFEKFMSGVAIDTVFEWTFGVNNYKKNKYLIGYLYVSNVISFIMLGDKKYTIVCEIAPNDLINYSSKMSKLLNSYVIIQNFHLFTEYTKKCKAYHYIFCNIKDINSIHKKELEPKVFHNNFNLKVIHRCTVSIKNENLECWVHSAIKVQEDWKECFIRLCESNFAKYPLFNSGDEYIIYTDNVYSLKQIRTFQSFKTFKLNNNSLPVFVLPKNCEIKLINYNNDEKLSNIEEIKSIMEENKNTRTQHNLLSFEGIIQRRRTLNQTKYSSQTVKNKAFGIRGSEVHQVVLRPTNFDPNNLTEEPDPELLNLGKTILFYDQDISDAEKVYFEKQDSEAKVQKLYEKLVSVYMHNWEQLQTPLGLVVNMKVAVRNVMLAPSSKYFKPTFVSRIQPLQYLPQEEFQTTPEFLRNEDWGPPVSLSASQHIPTSCLCWGPALTLSFTTLKISMRCKMCNEPYVSSQNYCCITPQGPAPIHLDAFFGLRGRDPQGTFDFLSRSWDVLKLILGLGDGYFKIITRACLVLRQWSINEHELDEEEPVLNFRMYRTDNEELFAKFIKQTIKSVNKKGIHNIDIKCRKMEKKETDQNNNQKWYALEARPGGEVEYL